MPHPLERQIGHTRRQARRLLVNYGIGWTLASVLLVVLVLGLSDYLLRFEDRGIRLMCSLAALAALAAAAYRFCYLPLSRRLSDVEIALRIERRFPQLGERLSSAVEFLRRSEDDLGAGSATLRRSVIHNTGVAVADLNLDEALDRRPTRRALMAAGGVLLVALLLVACSPRLAWLAAARLAKPFGDEHWPRQNNLAFRSAPTRLAAGDPFDAELVDSGGRLPDEVRIIYRYENANGVSDVTETAHPQSNLFVAHKDHVERPFSYRAEGGDDRVMEWRAVDVVETPRVESLKVSVAPPAYTGWPAETGEGQIQALRGSRLEFTGSATKQLTAVAWRQGDRVIPGIVAPDGLGFRVPGAAGSLLVEGSGPYSFELTGVEGLASVKSDHWEIRAVADQVPTVVIEQPPGNIFVTAAAAVPIKVTAKDDLAIHDISLHAMRSDRSETGELKIELFTRSDQDRPAVSPAGGLAGEMGESRSVEYSWSLEPLQLKAGAQVTFFATAVDFLPQQGSSAARKLTIISPQELEDRIAQRQNQILGEVAHALKLQRETRSQTTALEIQLREIGKLNKADLDRAQAAELNQRQVTRALAGDRDGIQTQIKELFTELESNRIDSPDLKRRMQEMLDEIGRLRDEHLGPIERELTSAVKDARSELANSTPAGNQPPGEKQPGEKQPSEKQPGEKQPSEKQPGEKQPGGQQTGGKAAPDEKENQQAPASAVARELAAAGEHQDHVVESLEAMLGRLSQWDNYRRFGREIAQLRQQQDELLAGTREAAAKTLTKELKDLDPQQQADLKKLAARQNDLARQLDKLEQQMAAARERLADDDPLAAEALGDALQQARDRVVSGQMRKAGEQAERNQVSQAIDGQKQVSQELEDLQNILSNRREQELGRLVRKLKEAEKDLEQIRKRQAGLRKKMADIAKQSDAAGPNGEAEKKKELERLTRQQRQLQEDSQRMARRLERLQAERAGQKLTRAAGRMGESGQAGEQGNADGAQDAAEEAQQDLDEAQQQLAQQRRKAEADLAQEQMARIEDSIKSMRDRQAHVRAEAARYDQLLRDKGRLTRGEAGSVQDLSRQEKGLAAETLALAEKVAAAEVFHLVLSGAAEDMRQASDLLNRRDTGPAAQESLASAERRLDRVVTALVGGKKPGEGKGGKQGGGQGGEGQGGGKGGEGGIRSIAELKLLKLMQEDLFDRFKSETIDQSRSPADRAERLERLSGEQGRLAELTLKLSKPEADNPEDNPEKLPDVRERMPDDADRDGPAEKPRAATKPNRPGAPADDVAPIELNDKTP